MAKINLSIQHNQENLSLLISLGALMCMVVTLVGIKFWWFKHRLSFEQSRTENAAADGVTPAVIVPRRSKQQKYKKDKRYSQQIYSTVEVHGVFRQKPEDDVEIQRPHQLPPVRIRQLSESTSSLALPPPRTKRRDQVHSTAFEDLEIITPALTTSSSSDLTAIPEINTKITLTFEEFESQFNLKEIKSEVPEPLRSNNEAIEIPAPPLRLNRSSSAMTKPEKSQHFLKSSQSITIPEFRKTIEKRPTGFSSPKEDLTKIDDYDERKVFETFGERRPTGYIKYEEVDGDLHEQYERELNEEVAQNDYHTINNNICEIPKVVPALKALRNERIIYNNDLNESPDILLTEEYNFYKKSYKWEDADYKNGEFINHRAEIKELNSAKVQELDTKRSNKLGKEYKNVEENVDTVCEIIKGRTPSELSEKEFDTDHHRSVKERKPIEHIKQAQIDEKKLTTIEPEIFQKVFFTKCYVPTEFDENSQAVENTIVSKLNSDNEYTENPRDTKEYLTENRTIEEQNPKDFLTIANVNTENFDSISFQEDFDNQFIKWPQFEEKIETPKVNVRKFNSQGLNTQASFTESDDFAVTNFNEISSIPLTGHETAELKDIEEWQRTCNKKFYSQIRSFMATEDREVTFDSAVTENSDSEQHHNSAIKERRPTGFVRKDEYFVTFSDESDEDSNHSLSDKRGNSPDNTRSNIEIIEMSSHKVNFIDSNLSNRPENEVEKFTLNQRRPTGFVKPLDNADNCNNPKYQDDCKDFSNTQVKFAETTAFKDEQDIWNSEIKQRRPTGYTKELEMLDLADDDGSTLEQQRQQDKEHDAITRNNLVTKETLHHSPAVNFKEIKENFKDYDNNDTESLLKQRQPTGFAGQQELDNVEKQVQFYLENEDNATGSGNNEALNERRPTGFIRKEEITKHVNFQLNENSSEDEKTQFGNEQLRQRRPTGWVRKKELKCLEQPAPIYQASNDNINNNDFDNHLWQEMEKDLEQDVANNIEEEFAKIRHSYEVNEADFLEVKDELQKSSINNNNQQQQLLGFGKSIEDDWENFEKLKSQTIIKTLQSPQEIEIIFSDAELNVTASILKEHKLDEDIPAKPRKSKVTFDFNTDEHVIPARKIHKNFEEDSDYDDDDDDDVYDRPPPPIPPQPKQRASNINYNAETTLSPIVPMPKGISLFGSRISTEDNVVTDSWSAIRKHRNLTEEFKNLSTDSKFSPPQSAINAPPKPIYRNPMAQLAIQRAKEVRADMDGFKSRSINDRKTETSKRQKQQFLNLNSSDHESTEA